MKTLSDIRAAFLGYFADQSHKIVESSPLVPRNDPSLLFVNSGMVQFKNVFTGLETRPYTRAASAQKSVRAGGKHNDLENVGYTARHHTFFEMLGNFSFGDYFKETAIDYAWQMVTKQLGLPKEKLLVTVYAEDEEAAALWKKIAGLSEDKIIRIASSDNFWQMGDTGPCGPCSEIFFDHGDGVAGGPPGSAEQDGDRFIEIWNLVFMQYEQLEPGNRLKLPRPSIDTGMGLERVAAVLQGVHSNYETDLFVALIEASEALTATKAVGAQQASHRVIADHLRSSAFLLADGVMPGNEGRGYVLRRIMRRAMRHAHILGAREPLLHRLVPELVRLMGAAYPELVRAQPLISQTLHLEETRFKQTLERGLKLLDDETARLEQAAPLSGAVAFKLYDTFGFPLDLTQDVLRGRGRTVDIEGFTAAMDQQKAAARKNWAGSGEAATARLWFELRDAVGGSEFLGYSAEKAQGLLTALVVDGARVEHATPGQKVSLLFNQTPFYGESGGQAGDAGEIVFANGAKVAVETTRKEADSVVVHVGAVTEGTVKMGDAALLTVDGVRRAATKANHSATHLLHAALRRVLGAHVSQKGSQVTHERLRFDFSHGAAVKAEEIAEIERLVNQRIRANAETVTRLLTPEAAIAEGACAMFGEKYGEEVRVLSIGGAIDAGEQVFSMELCGGTHVQRAGDIGFFKLVSESAVAAGIRRIEAVTGEAALAYVREQETLLKQAAELLKTAVPEAPARIALLLEERKKLERELADLRRQAAMGGAETAIAIKKIGTIAFTARLIADLPAKDLKPMADALRQQMGSGVIALAALHEGKVALVTSVSADLIPAINAVDLVKIGAEALGGKGGGGRPDMAQAGGTDPSKAEAALAAIEAALATK